MRNAYLAAAIAMALPLPAAFAQGTPESTATLGDIIVTAQRRSENIQDVPVSVSTVQDEALDVLTSGGDDIRLLSGRLPSLLIESSFGRAFPRFYIRGLGNTDFDLNSSQPVSLVYDDVVQENPILKGFPIFDLEMVEIFRGPQGTLFGRNTPAGVVKLNSVRPSRELGGYARAAFGTHSSLNVEGAVGGALGENWSMRLSGLYQHRDDWVDNVIYRPPVQVVREGDEFEGFDDIAGRLQFLYNSGSLEALVNVHARTLDGTARMFRSNIFTPGTNDLVPGFSDNVVSLDGQNKQDLDSVGGSLRISYEFGRVALHSITGYESVDAYSVGDIDGGFGDNFNDPPAGPGFIAFSAESADGMSDHSQFTQEFRWESRDWDRFNWQAGVYYFDEDISIETFNYLSYSNHVLDGYATQDQKTESWAAFGSVQFDLTDSFVLGAGLRYTEDEKEFTAQRFDSPPFQEFVGGALPIGPIGVAPQDDEVTWDVSGTWSITDDTNLYARVASGYRAPSVQGRTLFSNSNDPAELISVGDSETIISYEAGVKSNLFGGRGRVSLSIYKFTMDDQQLTAVGGGSNFNTLINADQTDGQGVELDFQAYLTENFLVTLGASYNDTEIDDPNLAIQACGGGCTILDPIVVPPGGPPFFPPAIVNIDGNTPPQSPEIIANLTARWGMPVAAGEFYIYTDWAYRDEVNFFLYESAEFTGQDLLEGGIRVGYNWADGKREIAIYGRNITDETEAVGAIDFNNLTGFVNEPERWFLEFRTEF
jgi:iron complex outermembrane receptor protein